VIKRRLRVILLCIGSLIALGLVVLLWPSPALYRVTVLPSLGGKYATPCGMNDRGQIVGISQTAEGERHMFLWDREKGMQDLGTVGVGGDLAINDAGQIAGTIVDANGNGQAFLRDPNGGMQLLGALGGGHSYAEAINDLGQVVGRVEMPRRVYHAFLWDRAGGMRDLGRGHSCRINDGGQIVFCTPTGVFLLDADASAGGISIPICAMPRLNNHGCVIGYSPASVPRRETVIWRRGLSAAKSMQLGSNSSGWAINDANQVLFTRERPARFKLWGRVLLPYRTRCYLHDPARGSIPLDRYLPAEPDERFTPVDLNNKGCIILSSRRGPYKPYRAMLLEPIRKRWGK